MNFAVLATRNLTRNKTRVALTILGVAAAVLTFLLLRTVVWAWTFASETGAQDRVATRHKVSFILTLPRHYVDKVREVPGVQAATWMNWFGAKDPKNESDFFASLAVDHTSFPAVYKEDVVIPPEAFEAWKTDPQGAIIGDVLADRKGWKVGDKVTLLGTIFPGDWEFRIVGIYTITSKSFDRSQFLFRWDYLNNKLPEGQRDQIGWVLSRIDDPRKSADITQAIDRRLEDYDQQTLSQSERALNTSFMGMFSAVLAALDLVSIVILLIMMLILGNTIAMGVRERTYEYGVMRAIGFLPRHVALFIMGEGLFIGLLGGIGGLVLALPLIGGVGRWIEEGQMASIFPFFRLQATAAILAIVFAVLLGGIASLIPAYRTSLLSVTDALRRVG
jgi:putative ABC transport system permease protein